ncbi:M42 family metallopeptidase [Bacillus sp. JCM 19041]|uniref:M42 family metallopeptidase n=1 Tax=Bacillus sp. JCM 19041 TaxID=1460637 RepID=UPI0006D09736
MVGNTNVQETAALLKQLVEIPSPSGFTNDVIDFVESYLNKSGIQTMKTNKGALIATIEGTDNVKQRMLTAHVDTLGAITKEIKANGRIKIDLIGGFAYNSIEGEYVEIHKADGTTISGTIVMHQSSVHVYKDAKTAERNQQNIEVRIDAPVKTAQDTRDLGIEVGDFISFAPRFEHTEGGFIKSRHLDDKASVALVLRLFEQLTADGMTPAHTTHVLISNNEEIGYGGNANIPTDVVEYIAVDMGAIGDGQQSDEYTVSICVKDASGPYHYGLRNHLIDLCKQNQIPYKVDIYPYYGSDASAAIKAGHDIVHGLIGPGIEGSHSMERTHESSLEATYRLLETYVLSEMKH